MFSQSPTIPYFASLKIFASGSLFIATITLEPVQPAICWLAPEIATVMYTSGVIVLPVRPTCWLWGIHPESTAARDAPTAPSNRSASSPSCSNGSGPPRPLPPATTILASSN